MAQRSSELLDAIWYRGHPLKWVLWPLSALFAAAVRLRRALYRSGVRKAAATGVPVVVVGNVTVGGTGKTPCVVWLARELTQRGYAVGIVSRGYGGRAKVWPQRVGADSDPALCGDEPVLLARRTACPVVAGPDRVDAVRTLIREADIDVVLSDDGLQHYRLSRDVEIAVVDGERGFGNGLCLPAGPLREPASRLDEADAVIVNGGRFRNARALHAVLAPSGAVNLASGRQAPLDAFRGAAVHAVAGIGHPQRFFDLLTAQGLRVLASPLMDHAIIRADQITFDDPLPVLVTEKDAVKCRGIAHPNLWCVTVELRFAGDGGRRLLDIVTSRLKKGAARA